MEILLFKGILFVLLQVLMVSLAYRTPRSIWGESYTVEDYIPNFGPVLRKVETRKWIHRVCFFVCIITWYCVMVLSITRGFELIGIQIGEFTASWIIIGIILAFGIIDRKIRGQRKTRSETVRQI